MAVAALAGIPRGDRVRAARELRALTQRQTVERLDRPISAAALSQIESDKVRATTETLHDLAHALEVPVEYFGTAWPTGAGPDVSTRVTYFRDLAATPSKQRRRAAALAGLLNELVAAIEVRVRLPAPRLPSYPMSAEAGMAEIEATAEAVRGEWDLGDGPISHMVNAIEAHGVPIAQLALGVKTVDAFSVRFPSRPLIFLMADKSNYVRSRFDAAHELGHLIAHAHADELDRSIEQQAHRFAAALLLPREAALEYLPRRIDAAGWRQLADMKGRWGVSIAALLMRARVTGMITGEAHQNAMRHMSMRGWRTKEPGDQQMGPPESARLFERAFSAIHDASGESIGDVIRASNLPLQDCLQLISAAGDSRPALVW